MPGADGNEGALPPRAFEQGGGLPEIVGGDAGFRLPDPPKVWEMGASTDFSYEAEHGISVDADVLLVGRSPATGLELVRNFVKEGRTVLEDPELTDVGKQKRLLQPISKALAEVTKIEAALPRLAAQREQALAEVARQVTGAPPDATELQRRALVQNKLASMAKMDAAKQVLTFISEGSVSELRAVLDMPPFVLNLTDVTLQRAREKLVELTTDGSAASAKAERLRRVIANGEQAVATTRRWFGGLIQSGDRGMFEGAGLIEKRSQDMSLAERAAYIERHGLTAWRQLVFRSHGGGS